MCNPSSVISFWVFLFFFFKQKTAYEIGWCDWSSDVCSSDLFDLTNPEAPKQTYEKVTGKQVNMISQSWDGKRVYNSSSLLENWDKGGADNEQFVRAFTWDGKELKPAFEVDFTKEKLGRAHHMKF